MYICMQEQRDVLLTADIGGTNCRFSLWQANIKADVVYDEVFTKVDSYCICATDFSKGMVAWCDGHANAIVCKALGQKPPPCTCECSTCSMQSKQKLSAIVAKK